MVPRLLESLAAQLHGRAHGMLDCDSRRKNVTTRMNESFCMLLPFVGPKGPTRQSQFSGDGGLSQALTTTCHRNRKESAGLLTVERKQVPTFPIRLSIRDPISSCCSHVSDNRSTL